MTFPSFPDTSLQAISDVLGETNGGLTGGELTRLLHQQGLVLAPGPNKRSRLYDTLRARQVQDRCGNAVAQFVVNAMNPIRYTSADDRPKFAPRRAALNQVLGFCGLAVTEAGQLAAVAAARTLAEAETKADRLKRALTARAVHADVLRFCKAELLEENYFHAVLEATKSLGVKMREKTGARSDGSALVDEVCTAGSGHPRLAFNRHESVSERNEQSGLANIMRGLFSAFRNPAAHEPRITWTVTEQDALDILAAVSLIHRKLDQAVALSPAMRGQA